MSWQKQFALGWFLFCIAFIAADAYLGKTVPQGTFTEMLLCAIIWSQK